MRTAWPWRYGKQFNARLLQLWEKAAFEHEFSGACMSVPSFGGSSGMGEFGIMMKPSEDLPLSINLGEDHGAYSKS
ncbi:MAG: hypothetical protein Q3990_07140 [Desulfovibrionaceae bacterium]|nr:hypothetical protein [Desulfovibrionaceae bacterium]